MSKPREWWWLSWAEDHVFDNQKDAQGAKEDWGGEITHVIEYSAYLALAQAAKDFMSALTEEEKILATDKLSTLISEVDL